VFGKPVQLELQSEDRATFPIESHTPCSNLLNVPVDALPQDALGVDGANEELQHKLPAANTEGDGSGSV
jgi:hypothetical protein